MLLKKKNIIKFLKINVFFLYLIFVIQAKGNLPVIVAYEPNNRGDYHQASGVINALNSRLKASTTPFYTDFFYASKHYLEIAHPHKPAILITFGTKGGKLLESLQGQTCWVLVHLSHNKLPHHEAIVNWADCAALPEWCADGDMLSIIKRNHASGRFVLTQGVPHELKKGDCQAVFRKYQHLIPKSDYYVALILGGDVKDATGKVHHFTSEDALWAAERVVEEGFDKNAHIILMSSPRTGRFLAGTSEADATAHKGQTDKISERVKEKILETIRPERLTFFDFQYDDQIPYSQILLGLMSHKPGKIFIPGESVSTLSEVAFIVQPEKILIYTFPELQEEDLQRVQFVSEQKIHSCDLNKQTLRTLRKEFVQAQQPSELIAAEIINALLKKNCDSTVVSTKKIAKNFIK